MGTPWPLMGARSSPRTGGVAGGSSPTKYEGSSKSILCCTKIQFLEAMLTISAMAHILAISLAYSIIYYGEREDIEFRGHFINSTATGSELMVVGVTGTLVNIFGVLGLWKRQRLFLVPVILFLMLNLAVDFITGIAFFVAHLNSDELRDARPNNYKMEGVEISKLVSPLEHSQDRSFAVLFPFLLIKLTVSMVILRCLLDVYKRDPTMRTTRSPLRNITKQPEQTTGEEGEEEPAVPKLKKYYELV